MGIFLSAHSIAAAKTTILTQEDTDSSSHAHAVPSKRHGVTVQASKKSTTNTPHASVTGVDGFKKYKRWVSSAWSGTSSSPAPLLTDIGHILSNAVYQVFSHPIRSISQLLGHPSFAELAKAQVPDVVVKAVHPVGGYPVILVHGTGDNPAAYVDLAPALSRAGFDTYTPYLGHGGPTLVGLHPEAGEELPVGVSVQQLANYIAKVQAETGAQKVNLVGHSQGGLLIKDYLAHDTKNNVQSVVDLAASNHGTTGGGLSTLFNVLPRFIKSPVEKLVSFVIGQASLDQLVGSDYIKQSDKNPDTVSGVHYLVLSDRDDTEVTPYDSTYLKAVPGADVTNLEIHSLPGVSGTVPHIQIPENPGVIAAVTRYISAKGVLDAKTTIKQNNQSGLNAGQIVEPPVVELLQ